MAKEYPTKPIPAPPPVRAHSLPSNSPHPVPLAGGPFPPDSTPSVATKNMPPWLRLVSTPVALSLVAVVLSLVALAVALLHDPLGKGMGAYDFSTPEAAAKSMLQIRANRDIRAQLDLESDASDAVRTLEIDRVRAFGDKQMVFISYMKQGRRRRYVESLVQNQESKRWVPTYIPSYAVEKTNPQLAKEMEAWTKDSDSD